MEKSKNHNKKVVNERMKMSKQKEDLLKEKLSELYSIGIFSENAEQRIKKLEEFKKFLYVGVSDSQLESYQKIFRALGSKTRLSILKLIMQGVKCSCEIEYLLGFSQSTVSHHLKLLSESKIISLERTGKWTLANVPLGMELTKESLLKLLESILK